MRVGLVLGGGGTFALGYHAGALAALANDLRWDPRESDVVVGTSAGSLIGALLRSGVPPHDLAASMAGADLLETPPAVAASLLDRPTPPPIGVRQLARLPRVPHLALVSRLLARPWTFEPAASLASLLPDGTTDLLDHLALLRDWTDGWPSRPLWINAVRQRDVRHVVFGRADHPAAELRRALGASCAVPGYFRPIEIGGDRYVDGGVRSPTNADTLVGRDLDLAVIVSPMSWHGGLPPVAQRPWRRYARRKVWSERRRLAAAGVPSIVLAPGPEVTRPFGSALMAQDGLGELTRASFFDAGRQLRDPAVSSLVRLL